MENKNNPTWVCVDGPSNILGRESELRVRDAKVGEDIGLFEVLSAQCNGYDPSALKIFYVSPKGESWTRITSPRVAKHHTKDVLILESPFGGENYVLVRKR